MNKQKILIPYNFTSKDNLALDFVIRTFINQEDVEITLFNAYVPAPEINMRNNPVMEKMSGNLSYLRKKVYELENALEDAKQSLVRKGFNSNNIRCIFEPKEKDIAQDIINLVLKEKFDVVVINRKPGKVTRFFTGSVFDKVVTALNGVTVCIVT